MAGFTFALALLSTGQSPARASRRLASGTPHTMEPHHSPVGAWLPVPEYVRVSRPAVTVTLRHSHAWMWQEARRGVRRAVAYPATATLAVCLLTVAVGLMATMLAAADALLLRRAPFPQADRIAGLWMRDEHGGRTTVSPQVLQAWSTSGAFEAVEAASTSQVMLHGPQGPTTIPTAFVTRGLFGMLDVQPVLGRLFHADEARTGGDAVLMSERLWRSAFGADPNVVGRRLSLDDALAIVVGILPSRFHFPLWDTELWRPIDFGMQPSGPRRRPAPYVTFTPRVPEVDALKIATETSRRVDSATALQWAERMPVAGPSSSAAYVARAIPLLAGTAAMVFVVLLANAIGILVIRIGTRQDELRIAAALGATRGRLLWQVGVETATYTVVSTAAGIGLAWLLVSLLDTMLPAAVRASTLNPLDMDGRAIGAALLCGALATVFTAAASTWSVGRLLSTGSVGGRLTTPSRVARLATRGLVALQFAVAVTLLLGATLLVRTLLHVSNVPVGFDPSGVLVVWLQPAPGPADNAARTVAFRDAATALAALPGVQQVTSSKGIPLFIDNGTQTGEWQPDGHAAPARVDVRNYRVGPGWFEAYGIRLIGGRGFTAADGVEGAIISRDMATALWPRTDPVGRTFRSDGLRFQVIGVAEELRSPIQDAEHALAEFYRPLGSNELPSTFGLRCADACPSEGLIRQRLARLAPGVSVVRLAKLQQLHEDQLAVPRLTAALGLLFGVVAAVVAAAGLFVVMTQAVRRRRREFGIRAALGSRTGALRSLVWREAFATVAPGLLVGSMLGGFVSQSIRALLYGLQPADVLSWGGMVVAVIAIAMAGVWWPSQQAARMNPAILLREN